MRNNTRKLVTAAITGALYAVLTMALAPISYGPLQLRVSEVMCILPYFVPCTAYGLFFGCAIANLVSAAGVLDIVFGSLATLVSCIFVSFCGRKDGEKLGRQFFACAIPVICNGLIIGAVLCYTMTDLAPHNNFVPFLIYAGQVALGEAAVMFAMGLPLMRKLPKLPFFAELLTKYN